MTLNDQDTGLFVFLFLQMKGQLQRLQNDNNYRKLGDDAKLAVGGLVRGVEIMKELHDRTKNP